MKLRAQSWSLPEPILLILLAVLIGIVGGLGAVVFRLLISAVRSGFHWLLQGAFPLPHPLIALSPVLGLMIVGAISTYLAREVKGHGVPQILESLALRGGRIRPRVGFFGILAPALTIGSGGSVGREGPIALIGASFGSLLGQTLKLPDRYIMLLVGCGAAAGIGATFNAPIAGALFAMEVVLGSYAMGTIVPSFVASVVGVTVFNSILGSHLALPVPPLAFRSPFSIVVMGILGVVAGLFGIAYSRGLTVFEDLFDHRLKWPFWGRALVGGLAVGILGLGLPGVLGVGYGTMGAVSAGTIAGAMVVVLLIAKYFATLTTIGAGGSGGVFAPSLYLGLMLGTSYGMVAHGLFPHALADARVFGVAGMGAVFAAAAQAPLTAVVIVLEMTGAYKLTMGVVMASAIAYFVYGSLQGDTMYTVRLSRRGVRILRGAEIRPMQQLAVSAAMRSLDVHLTLEQSMLDAQASMAGQRSDALIVEDSDGRYVGVLEAPTVMAAAARRGLEEPIGRESLNRVPPVTPNLNLDDAMQRFALYECNVLPVEEGERIVGVLSRGDVLRVYQTRTALSLETSRRVAMLQQTTGDPGAFQILQVPQASVVVGKALSELALPRSVVVVCVDRGGTVLVPHGDTVIQEDDRLVVYANPSSETETLRQLVLHSAP